MKMKNGRRSSLVAGTLAMALTVGGCENMNTGGWLGMIGGAAAGAYAGDAYMEPEDGSGDGSWLLFGAVIGGSIGMLLGSGAVTPGEMAQGMADANENMKREEQEKVAEAWRNAPPLPPAPAPSASSSSSADDYDLASEPNSSEGGQSAQSHGDRVMAQEEARAEQLKQEREARAAEEKRQQEEQLAARKKREEEARRQAEIERNRPVEWVEGVVLCEPRSGSKQWRCTGPLQMNILELDAPNTIAQLGLACGSSNGIREIGQVGIYRAYGCGFGIHPTDRNYPGNRDVPKDFGVYVGDRRVFHCPKTKDAYCRNP